MPKPKPKPGKRGSGGRSGLPETVADLGEFGFIETLRRRLPQASGSLPIGVGDDAAWWRPAAGNGILTTTDMLVNRVHFDLDYTTAADLGYKSLAVNLSDLAAMGGEPVCAYLALALPAELEKIWLDEYITAFLKLAQEYNVQLAGGDTVAARDLTISVTLNGLAPVNKPILRSGAAVNDDIYVSGSIGDSFCGLKLLQKIFPAAALNPAEIAFLQGRHLRPAARVRLGRTLAACGRVNAMLDISDGVVADLGHLLTASGELGAELDQAAIPLSPAAAKLEAAGVTDLPDLLTGGEDYELLFCANPGARAEIAEIARACGVNLTRIGRVNDKRKILMLVNGKSEALSGRRGYDHFRN